MTEENLNYGTVGFIDILGFGDEVTQADTSDKIKALATKINSLQQHFQIDPKHPISKDYKRNSGITTLGFSDCLVFHKPFHSKSNEYLEPIPAILSHLITLAFSQGLCVFDEVFIRGGG